MSGREPAPAQPEATNPALLRYAGIGATLAGVVFLFTLVYTFGFLGSLGLNTEMLDDPTQLLPWIDDHTGAYLGLWGFFLLSLLLLLPTPLGLAEIADHGRAATRVATVAGIGGVLVGLVGVMVNAATAPVLAVASRTLEASPATSVLLLSELMGSLGLHLRLLSDLLIGIWLGMTGVGLARLPRWRVLGSVQVGVAAVTAVVVISKPLGWGDWEPFLGLLLALTYLWLGVVLLREHGARGQLRAGVCTFFCSLSSV